MNYLRQRRASSASLVSSSSVGVREGTPLVSTSILLTQATAAVGTRERPGHVLGFAGFDAGIDIGIAAMRRFLLAHCLDVGQIAQDGRDALHVGHEAHVIVPLVVDAERLDAAGDLVLRD